MFKKKGGKKTIKKTSSRPGPTEENTSTTVDCTQVEYLGVPDNLQCDKHSPYEGSRLIIIEIENRNYSIPENYVPEQLLQQRRLGWGQRIILGEIDAEIGHTILHFLYKGEYETIACKVIQPPGISLVELEYRRSLQVYYAATKYGIRGLEILARKYIESLGKSLSILQVLKGVKLVFSKLPEGDDWFRQYLYSKLAREFLNDETTFQRDDFYDKIMDDSALTKAVMKMVLSLFTAELYSLRNLLKTTDSENGIGRQPSDVDIHDTPTAAPGEPISSSDWDEEPGIEPPCDEDYPEPPEPCPESPEPSYEEQCPASPGEEFNPPGPPAEPTPEEQYPSEELPLEPTPADEEEVPVPIAEEAHDKPENNVDLAWAFSAAHANLVSASEKKEERVA